MRNMADRILFTIRENRTLPAETWKRFTEKAQQSGSTPARVLRDLVEQYIERPRHDTTPPQDRR